jgi:translation initiation factor 1A
MPPNAKGGKGYKKKKKQGNTDEPIFIDRQMGQMPARAIRLLGNRNVLCYSNDNVLRMCHICGKMKGRVFVQPGDVVLITLRDFMMSANEKQLKEVKTGDIVAKYDSRQFSALKKEEGVNQKIFMKLESGGHCVGEVGTDYTDVEMNVVEDTGFEFEHSDESDEEEDEKPPTASGIVEAKPSTRIVEQEEEDINIDDI